jgi:hypothetical protein
VALTRARKLLRDTYVKNRTAPLSRGRNSSNTAWFDYVYKYLHKGLISFVKGDASMKTYREKWPWPVFKYHSVIFVVGTENLTEISVFENQSPSRTEDRIFRTQENNSPHSSTLLNNL